METVLFTPVGVNDPIGFSRDGVYNEGAMLTIIREVRPSHVYLYLSNDAIQAEDSDNRYTKAIGVLAKELGISMQIEVIKEENEVPNRYVNYYKIFAKILSDINLRHQGCKICVNGSSGSPTIRSSLMVLATNLPFNISLKQVGVDEVSYSSSDVFEDKDFETIWEQVDKSSQERTWTIDTKYLSSLKLNTIIKDLINDFDYVRARKLVLRPMFRMRDPQIKDLLDISCLRLKNDVEQALKLEAEKGLDVLPFKEKEIAESFEYMLNLWIMLRQKRFDDFARSICPILDNIARAIITEERLNQLTHKDVESYGLIISDDKIIENHPDLINYLTSVNFVKLRGRTSFSFYRHCINYFYKDYEDEGKKRRLKEILTDLRRVEDRIKYQVNHTITMIDDSHIQLWTGLNSDSIFSKMLVLLGFAYPEYNFTAYFDKDKGIRQINQLLKDKIDQNFFNGTIKMLNKDEDSNEAAEEEKSNEENLELVDDLVNV